MRVITLISDFGWSDWFVGAMKGVILGLNSRLQLVDVTHAIAPGDIRAGAFALAASYAFFAFRLAAHNFFIRSLTAFFAASVILRRRRRRMAR